MYTYLYQYKDHFSHIKTKSVVVGRFGFKSVVQRNPADCIIK